MSNDRLNKGSDNKHRCWWCGDDPLYMDYHDYEWGRPVIDDIHLFEKICLEGFQAGLSWITVLRKRKKFRAAFDGFDFYKITQYDDSDIKRLLNDAGIIRHKGKIEATINNAHRAIEMMEEFGSLSKYFWQFEPSQNNRPKKMDYKTISQISITDESKGLSKDLKKRGWKFVGPTTCYAFMQAMGMVNDHLDGCHVREEIRDLRKNFKHL